MGARPHRARFGFRPAPARQATSLETLYGVKQPFERKRTRMGTRLPHNVRTEHTCLRMDSIRHCSRRLEQLPNSISQTESKTLEMAGWFAPKTSELEASLDIFCHSSHALEQKQRFLGILSRVPHLQIPPFAAPNPSGKEGPWIPAQERCRFYAFPSPLFSGVLEQRAV